MTLRAEIRAALVAGAVTREQLLKACPSAKDDPQLASNLSVLKGEGKIKLRVKNDRSEYSLGAWPEKSSRAAPPPQAQSAPQEEAQRRGKGSRHARADRRARVSLGPHRRRRDDPARSHR